MDPSSGASTPSTGLGDGSVEGVEGDVEGGEGSDVDVGEVIGEAVVIKVEHSEAGEIVDDEGYLAGDGVASEVEVGKVGGHGEVLREVAGYGIILEVGEEVGDVREVIGYGAGNSVVAEGEDAEAWEAAEDGCEDGAHKVDYGEVELDDDGAGCVALDACLVVGRGVQAPPEPVQVGDLREKSQQGDLLLNRRFEDDAV